MRNLNFDILENVCSSLADIPTVLSFSLVSHACHAVSIRRLLSMKPISLTKEATVRSFHQFLLGPNITEDRSRLLRGLIIDVLPDYARREEVAQLLIDILERATYLEYLELPSPQRMFEYFECPKLPEAMWRVSILREFVSEDRQSWCSDAEGIVKQTRSPLKVIRLGLFDLTFSDETGCLRPAMIGRLLEHLAPTLEVLEVTEASVLYNQGDRGSTFPAVHSALLGQQFGPVWTDVLINMFPALDGILDVGPLHGHDGAPLRANAPEQARIRALNRAYQERHSWTKLERVVGDTHTLYMLGLTCQVRHFMVDRVCSHRKQALIDFLRDAPPYRLKLTILLSHGLNVFDGLIPDEVASKLTHLVVMLAYDNCETSTGANAATVESMKWEDVLSKLKSSLRHCHQLTHLLIIVRCGVYANEPDIGYSRDFVTSVRSLDHEATAAELKSTVPSLRYILVTSNGCFSGVRIPKEENSSRPDWEPVYDLVTRGWFNIRTGWTGVDIDRPDVPLQRLRRLNDEVTESVVHSQELLIGPEDEFWLGTNREWSEDETRDWPYLP
ncbi:hypothetical protein C8Q73DRAFT_787201 [Cubamyces lactineus]|nr:hypothetical protein C8Q73DRAFT_787201 [Cubamyces lactineus]